MLKVFTFGAFVLAAALFVCFLDLSLLWTVGTWKLAFTGHFSRRMGTMGMLTFHHWILGKAVICMFASAVIAELSGVKPASRGWY